MARGRPTLAGTVTVGDSDRTTIRTTERHRKHWSCATSRSAAAAAAATTRTNTDGRLFLISFVIVLLLLARGRIQLHRRRDLLLSLIRNAGRRDRRYDRQIEQGIIVAGRRVQRSTFRVTQQIALVTERDVVLGRRFCRVGLGERLYCWRFDRNLICGLAVGCLVWTDGRTDE